MALTLRQLQELGTLGELARVLETCENAKAVLERIGYPRGGIPGPEDAPAFWEIICRNIDNGITLGGLDGLLSAALEVYPQNRFFQETLAEGAPPSPDTTAASKSSGRFILIGGAGDVYNVLDTARRIVQDLKLPGVVELDYHSAGTVMLHLRNMTPQEGERLERELAGRLQSLGFRPNISQGPTEFRDYLFRSLVAERPDGALFEMNNVPRSTRVSDLAAAVVNHYDVRRTVVDNVMPDGSVERMRPEATVGDVTEGTIRISPEAAPRDLRWTPLFTERIASSESFARGVARDRSFTPLRQRSDSLIRSLTVEGPEGSRFEVTNVPGSTRVYEIAAEVLRQYALNAWGEDRSGRPKPAVVDHVKPDGGFERMRPDSTLHETGITEASTLQVHPEATAGGTGADPAWLLSLRGPDRITSAAIPALVEYLRVVTGDPDLDLEKAEWQR